MSPSPILPILILLLSAAAAANANVDQTCKAAAASNYSVQYGFCTFALRTDPKSETADPHELGLIGAQLCLKNATSTRSKISEMIAKGNFTKEMKESLKLCSDEVYNSQIDLLTGAVNSFRSGNYSDALAKIDTVRGSAYDCSDIFFEGGEDDVLKKDESDLDGLSMLALFLIMRLRGR